jgi:hypothetical protein
MSIPTPEKVTVIDWPELKYGFLSGYETGNFPQQFRNRNGWTRGTRQSWNGCSADQMAGWLRTGFESPEFPIGDQYIPKSESRHMIFAEEGELDLPLAWSGHDYPYLAWETRKSKPGIRMVVEFGFSGAVNNRTIAKYGAWCLGTLAGLETRGYDIELDFCFTTTGQNSSVGPKSIIHSDGSGAHATRVRVKKEGELTDLTEFSALFSPGGYRILMFLATGIAADKIGARLDYAIGRCISHKTAIEYDENTSTLTVWANQMSDDFDFEAMSRMVDEALPA